MDPIPAELAAGSSAPAGKARKPREVRTDPPYQPSEDDLELVQEVQERINWSGENPARETLLRQLFEQILFYCGIQWIEYHQAQRRFARWSAPHWFPTPVTNEIAPRVATMVARLLGINPGGRVRPKSNDPEDREAATAAESLIVHARDVCSESKHRQRAALLSATMGTAVFYDGFDPRAGRRRRIPRTTLREVPAMESRVQCQTCGAPGDPEQDGAPCLVCAAGTLTATQVPSMFPDGSPKALSVVDPVLDEQGQPIVDEIAEGELETRTIPLFNFFWDSRCGDDLDMAEWCGEVSYLGLDWIDQHFPDRGPYVGEESGMDTSGNYGAMLVSLVGNSQQGGMEQGNAQVTTGGAVVRRYERKPCLKYPKGVVAYVAGKVLLYRGDLPVKDENEEPVGKFSYTLFQYDIVPGRLPGRTPNEDMVPAQRRINGIDAQVILNRKTLINPWVLAPKGSGLNPGQIALRPGSTLVYNFIGVGATPQVVQGEALPSQVYEERRQCLEAMDRMVQDSRIALGELPQGVKSGTALNYVKEQGDMASTPRLQRWADCMAERDRKRLLLMQSYYREGRSVKVLGRGSEWQVRILRGSDIRGATDIVVDPTTLVPQSRSAKEQKLFDAIEATIIDINNPVQRQRALEYLDLREFEDEVGPNRRRAEKEAAEMDQGIFVAINPEDNDEIHLLVELARIQDPSFDSLPPLAQEAHRAHKEQHMTRLATRMAQQDMAAQQGAANAEAAGGAEPAPGAEVASPPGSGDDGAEAAPMAA